MKRGFTLIELLVVMSIIVLLSAFVLINYRPGGQQLALSRSAHKLAQDIRRAQEMAMSAREFQGIVPAGYGIYLEQGGTSYLLYADTIPIPHGNERYDVGDAEVETIYLEEGVQIESVSPAFLSINFKPPDPTTKISGTGAPDADLATITLALEVDPTRTKTISVNNAGLIYVE